MAVKTSQRKTVTPKQGSNLIKSLFEDPDGEYSQEVKYLLSDADAALEALETFLEEARRHLQYTQSKIETPIPPAIEEPDLQEIIDCIKAALGLVPGFVPDEVWIGESAAATGYSSKHAIPLTNWLLVDQISSLEDSKAMIAAAMQMISVLCNMKPGDSSVDWSLKSDCNEAIFKRYLDFFRESAIFALGKSENTDNASKPTVCSDSANGESGDRLRNEKKRKADSPIPLRRSKRVTAGSRPD